jgi:hypothetical protein
VPSQPHAHTGTTLVSDLAATPQAHNSTALPCWALLSSVTAYVLCCFPVTGCPPGFGADPNGSPGAPTCSPCPPGTYRPGGNTIQPCWRCRGSAFLTSPPGASSLVQCMCRPGVSRLEGGEGAVASQQVVQQGLVNKWCSRTSGCSSHSS